MRHRPKNIALLSTFVVLALGVTASAASAAIQFEWKVNGAALASGVSKEFTAKDKTAVAMKWSFGGAQVEFTSSKLKVSHGSSIIGGKPGTSEGTLQLEGVKVTKPSECGVREGSLGAFHGEAEKISTVPLKSEIVEGAKGGLGDGKVDLLLAPISGTIMSEIEITGPTCGLKGLFLQMTGNLLVEMGPQKAEAKIGDLLFGAAKGEEYIKYNSTAKTAGLKFGVNGVTMTGEAETELVSKEAFGAF